MSFEGGEEMYVFAVCVNARHHISKQGVSSIRLLAGHGVEGDAHMGKTVKHRSRILKDPSQPNLRQVHLIHAELHDELAEKGFEIAPGEMGENITTRNVDLLGLPTGAQIRIGEQAVVEVTGLRNPCNQLNGLHPDLMAATLEKDANGGLIRKAGVLAIVLEGGEISPGDHISIQFPAPPHMPLTPV